MVHLPTIALVAGATVAVVLGCATAKPERTPAAGDAREGKSESMAGWPDSWGIEFGLRCSATGEDVRFCACVANEVKKRWTPEQFKSLGPEGLRDEVRACRERTSGVGAE